MQYTTKTNNIEVNSVKVQYNKLKDFRKLKGDNISEYHKISTTAVIE